MSDFVKPASLLPEQQFHHDVERLAGDIGERNFYRYTQLVAATTFLDYAFQEASYELRRQAYQACGQSFANLEVEQLGQRASRDHPRRRAL